MSADDPQVLARLTPSPARRVLALLILTVLGAALAGLAIKVEGSEMGARLALGAMALVSWLIADAVRRATRATLELTRDGTVREAGEGGRVLAELKHMRGVERGTFAFKPSNGFLIRLTETAPRAWAPGLWWRFRRSVGVGGVTPAAQGKFMAELLAGMIETKS